jgi:hypothetical protein
MKNYLIKLLISTILIVVISHFLEIKTTERENMSPEISGVEIKILPL